MVGWEEEEEGREGHGVGYMILRTAGCVVIEREKESAWKRVYVSESG